MSVYVIEMSGGNQEAELAPIAYRTFAQAKEYITTKAREEGWEIVDDYDKPEPDFEEDNVNRYRAGRARPAERPVGKTYIWAVGDAGEVHIIIYKLILEDPVGPDGGRRRRRRRTRR